MAKGEKSPRISVSLPERDYTEMQSVAGKYDVSVSWVARHAIAEFLARHKSGNLQLLLPLPLKGK